MLNHKALHRMAVSTSRVVAGPTLVAISLLLTGCNEPTSPKLFVQRPVGTGAAVHFSVIVDHWGSWVPDPDRKTETLSFSAVEGEDFGPENQPYLGEGKPFRLVTVLDPDAVLVKFDKGLVIAGEGISDTSQTNPVAVTSAGTRLRTRTTDWGTDYTLKLVR